MKIRTIFAPLTALLILAPMPNTRAENVESKAWRTTIPLFELRDASIDESIRALGARSRDLDPSHIGVNFVWPPSLPTDTRLNLRLANVPLYEAARYVGRLAGLRLDSDAHALIFTPDLGRNTPSKPRFSPAARAAQGLLLPRIEFRDATLGSAITQLGKAARAVDPAQAGVNVVLDIPPETYQRPITLSLTAVPLSEALRYAAELADLMVIEEPYALVVTTRKPSTSPLAPARNGSEARPYQQAWTPLSKPPEPVTNGGAMRDLEGDIQPDRSGYVGRRSMGGWPLALDPWNQLGSNCRPPTTIGGEPVLSSRCRTPHCPYCLRWDD